MKGIKQFIIVTGMSGAGKTMTLKVLEDIGFITIDSLPPELLPQLFQLFSSRPEAMERGVTATLDVRNVQHAAEIGRVIDQIEAAMKTETETDESNGDGNKSLAVKSPVRVIFLTASDEELLRRYERTRRIHPLSKASQSITNLSRGLSTREGIVKEREILTPVLERADVVIDTSMMDLHQHRERLMKEFFDATEGGVSLLLSSFGFKYGVPQDSNFILDVRCLPNPYYVDELKILTGSDAPVQNYLNTFPETKTFMERCTSFLDFVIPQYLNTVKGQLHIAVGCTGGCHRSVAVAEWLYERYRDKYHGVSLLHRDKPESRGDGNDA